MSPSRTERWRSAPVENRERERDIDVLLTVRQIDELLVACQLTLEQIRKSNPETDEVASDDSDETVDIHGALQRIHQLTELIAYLQTKQQEALT